MVERGIFEDYNVIDADGHVLESRDLWETYTDQQFRDRAIRLRLKDDGKEYIELDGRPSQFFNIKALASLGSMGRPASEIVRRIKNETYVESAPYGSMHAKERVDLLNREGLRATLLYPSIGLVWECEIEGPVLDIGGSGRNCATFHCGPRRERQIFSGDGLSPL